MPHINTKKTVSKIARNPKFQGLYSFSIGANYYRNLSTQQGLNVLRKFLNTLLMQVDAFYNYHVELDKIKNGTWDSKLLIGTSDFFAGASLPSLAIWNTVKYSLADGIKSINQGDIIQALSNIRKASYQLLYNKRQLDQYADKNMKGYDQSIVTLEYVKDGSKTIIGAYNPYIGAAYGTVEDLAQQITEVHYNMRDKVDWVGLSEDVVINELLTLAAGKISENIIQKLNTQELLTAFPLEAQQKIYALLAKTPQKLKEILIKATIGKVGDLIGNVVKITIDRLRNSHSEITWEKLKNSIAEGFTTKEITMNILDGVLDGRME